MKPLLLLVSLLVSDPRPLRDEDSVRAHCGGRLGSLLRTPRYQVGFLLHEEETRFPEPLASESVPLMCFISGDTSTAGGTGYAAVNNLKKCPDSASVWFVHHLAGVSGSSVPAFVLETSKGWAAAADAQGQKPLTKRLSAAGSVIISCCLKEREIRSAKRSRRQMAEPQMEPKEDEGQPSAGLQASSLNFSGLDAGSTENVEHVKLDQEQRGTKAASRVDNDDDDGFYDHRQKMESLKRQSYDPRPARDNHEKFHGKKITQAELRPPETEGETLGSIQNGNQKESDCTEDGEKGFISLFLPDAQMETQTEPAAARTIRLDTDAWRKTVDAPVAEPGEPPPLDSLCPHKCLREITLTLLEVKAGDRTRGRDLKPAGSSTAATTASAETVVVETTGNTRTNDTPHKNISINQTEHQQQVSPEAPATPRPPWTVKPDHSREAATSIKETTPRMEVFNHSSTRKTDAPPRTEETSTSTSGPEPGTEARCIKCKTRNSGSRTGKLFTGLRMREEVLAELRKLHKSEARNEDVTPTNGPENGRKEDENDPGGSSLKSTEPLPTTHTPDRRQTAADVPACSGLIHRTAAGRKLCLDRLPASRRFSSEEATRRAPVGDPYDHFYYIDGLWRRVRSHVYPQYRRQTGRAGPERPGTSGETLRSYIQRLVMKNKPSRR